MLRVLTLREIAAQPKTVILSAAPRWVAPETTAGRGVEGPRGNLGWRRSIKAFS